LIRLKDASQILIISSSAEVITKVFDCLSSNILIQIMQSLCAFSLICMNVSKETIEISPLLFPHIKSVWIISPIYIILTYSIIDKSYTGDHFSCIHFEHQSTIHKLSMNLPKGNISLMHRDKHITVIDIDCNVQNTVQKVIKNDTFPKFPIDHF
jgi:hypothetical protein